MGTVEIIYKVYSNSSKIIIKMIRHIFSYKLHTSLTLYLSTSYSVQVLPKLLIVVLRIGYQFLKKIFLCPVDQERQ